ncbi:MAG: sigma-70 family RNA polymerase sigma factor [Oscillospiraceae bacterium]|nr:sigma-70 family RNA polymerase sigma factor [Oscillospiraceae bacterium]
MRRSCGKEVSEAMDDEQMIALFFERSEDALQQTKEKYGAACMHLLRNLLQNELDAEECANDVYLALWNTIPPERPEPFLTYLLKIARNQALRRITYNQAQRRGDGPPIPLEELENCIASTETVEQTVDGKLLEQEIIRFLRDLPKADRQLFIRRYWFCDSVEELAQCFGWSKSAIKSKLFRLRNRLRQHLTREGFL